jgi:triosephosphate isomerase
MNVDRVGTTRFHLTTNDQAPGADRRLSEPFFEFGPKNLLRLPEIIEVAAAAQDAGARCGVSVIVTVPTALIAAVRAAVPGVLVFAQGMDLDELGPSVGRVTAESLVDAGADGVMLNHVGNPLEPDRLRCGIRRAHANDLMTMVCAGTEEEVRRLLPSRPTTVLFEPPDLIGHTGGSDRPWIRQVDDEVRTAAPEVLMMHAGGVGTPTDAFQIMRSGAAGTGSTSGVLRDESPARAVGRFIAAVRRGFDDHQQHDDHQQQRGET